MPSSDSHPSGLSPISLVSYTGSGVSVLSLILRPVHGSASVHQGLLPHIGVGAMGEGREVSFGILTNGWLWPSLCLLSFTITICWDQGIVINWEKSDLQPSTWVRYLGMVIDASQERMLPSDARMSHFQDLAIGFLALPSPPARMWQQLLDHMSSLELFLPGGHSRMHPL